MKLDCCSQNLFLIKYVHSTYTRATALEYEVTYTPLRMYHFVSIEINEQNSNAY